MLCVHIACSLGGWRHPSLALAWMLSSATCQHAVHVHEQQTIVYCLPGSNMLQQLPRLLLSQANSLGHMQQSIMYANMFS